MTPAPAAWPTRPPRGAYNPLQSKTRLKWDDATNTLHMGTPGAQQPAQPSQTAHQAHYTPRPRYSHSRAHLHLRTTRGERIADAVAAGMGSWRFIIAQSCVVLLWMTLNILAFAWRWDPYPFILLNLLFSTQAAYAAPIIMMAQNRQAAVDRKRDDHEAQEVDSLFSINQRQMEMLNQQTETLRKQDEVLRLLRERPVAQPAAPATPAIVNMSAATPLVTTPVKRSRNRNTRKAATS